MKDLISLMPEVLAALQSTGANVSLAQDLEDAIEADRKRRGEPVGRFTGRFVMEPDGSKALFVVEAYGAIPGPGAELFSAPQPTEPTQHPSYDRDCCHGHSPEPECKCAAHDAQPAEPVKVPSDDVQRDASEETWMGMRVAAYQWEVENDFGKMTRHAMHWSTGPKDAERLYRESDVRALLTRYGNTQQEQP